MTIFAKGNFIHASFQIFNIQVHVEAHRLLWLLSEMLQMSMHGSTFLIRFLTCVKLAQVK